MVSIQTNDGSLHCGGSIVASDKIITAAHCFIDPVSKEKMTLDQIRRFQVVVGTDSPYEHHCEFSCLNSFMIFMIALQKIEDKNIWVGLPNIGWQKQLLCRMWSCTVHTDVYITMQTNLKQLPMSPYLNFPSWKTQFGQNKTRLIVFKCHISLHACILFKIAK